MAIVVNLCRATYSAQLPGSYWDEPGDRDRCCRSGRCWRAGAGGAADQRRGCWRCWRRSDAVTWSALGYGVSRPAGRRPRPGPQPVAERAPPDHRPVQLRRRRRPHPRHARPRAFAGVRAVLERRERMETGHPPRPRPRSSTRACTTPTSSYGTSVNGPAFYLPPAWIIRDLGSATAPYHLRRLDDGDASPEPADRAALTPCPRAERAGSRVSRRCDFGHNLGRSIGLNGTCKRLQRARCH